MSRDHQGVRSVGKLKTDRLLMRVAQIQIKFNCVRGFLFPSPTFSETVDFLRFRQKRSRQCSTFLPGSALKSRKSTLSSCGRGPFIPLSHIQLWERQGEGSDTLQLPHPAMAAWGFVAQR